MLGAPHVRGSLTGWSRVVRREAERRRIAARHALAVASHARSIRRARRAATGYAVGATATLSLVPVTHGYAEVGWGAAGVYCLARTGQWLMTLRHRSRSPLPQAPALPPALPAPPPLASSAWPALRRVDAARAALRGMTASAPPGVQPLARSALDAATALDEAARVQAARVAATEAALRSLTGTAAAPMQRQHAELGADLDRAAAAAEELVAAAARLVSSPGELGYAAADALRGATDDALARAHGLRVAATVRDPGR